MIEGISGRLERFNTRDEWLEARRNSVGGSDAAAIVTGKSLDVYSDKLGLKEDEDRPVFERGRLLEPVVADKWSEQAGCEVEDYGLHLFRSTEKPFQHYSADRIIPKMEGKNGPGIAEIKTVPFMTQQDLNESTPEAWLAQPQHGMNVCELEWSCLIVLAVVPWTVSWIVVDRNDRFIEALNDRLDAFWDRVQNQDPPPPEDIESSRKALARLYPHDNGETIDLSDDALEIAAQFERAKVEEKHWHKIVEEKKNAIKALIGPNTFGLLPTGDIYSLTTTTKASFVMPAQQYRQLRRRKAK